MRTESRSVRNAFRSGEELPLCVVEIFSVASMIAASLFSFSATPSAIVTISWISGFGTAAEIFLRLSLAAATHLAMATP